MASSATVNYCIIVLIIWRNNLRGVIGCIFHLKNLFYVVSYLCMSFCGIYPWWLYFTPSHFFKPWLPLLSVLLLATCKMHCYDPSNIKYHGSSSKSHAWIYVCFCL